MLHKLLFSFIFLALSVNALASDNPQVKITTSLGEIELQLDRNKAPKTVNNFLQYVKDGFYTKTIFHRVIKGFMIQGGGFTADQLQKKTRQSIVNEATNGLKNDLGTIAMARTNIPHSASSQFFINTADNAFLNHSGKTMQGWGYAVFGKVTRGMEIVEAIENTKTGPKGMFNTDVPLQDIFIEKIEILSE